MQPKLYPRKTGQSNPLIGKPLEPKILIDTHIDTVLAPNKTNAQSLRPKALTALLARAFCVFCLATSALAKEPAIKRNAEVRDEILNTAKKSMDQNKNGFTDISLTETADINRDWISCNAGSPTKKGRSGTKPGQSAAVLCQKDGIDQAIIPILTWEWTKEGKETRTTCIPDEKQIKAAKKYCQEIIDGAQITDPLPWNEFAKKHAALLKDEEFMKKQDVSIDYFNEKVEFLKEHRSHGYVEEDARWYLINYQSQPGGWSACDFNTQTRDIKGVASSANVVCRDKTGKAAFPISIWTWNDNNDGKKQKCAPTDSQINAAEKECQKIIEGGSLIEKEKPLTTKQLIEKYRHMDANFSISNGISINYDSEPVIYSSNHFRYLLKYTTFDVQQMYLKPYQYGIKLAENNAIEEMGKRLALQMGTAAVVGLATVWMGPVMPVGIIIGALVQEAATFVTSMIESNKNETFCDFQEGQKNSPAIFLCLKAGQKNPQNVYSVFTYKENSIQNCYPSTKQVEVARNHCMNNYTGSYLSPVPLTTDWVANQHPELLSVQTADNRQQVRVWNTQDSWKSIDRDGNLILFRPFSITKAGMIKQEEREESEWITKKAPIVSK
jgi:hypothetical protein